MSSDAIVQLREDHKQVRALFREYRGLAGTDGQAQDGRDGERERRETVERIIVALTVHTYLEEELFYPRVRREVPELTAAMDRAEQEHHVADLLCEELSRMAPEDEGYDAKAAVLIDAVERHIEQEEDEWFPPIRSALGRTELRELGERMLVVRETAPRRPTGTGVLHRLADALEE
ncbi:hemerythrin [Streptomyces tateyamensis]|uniref:Hemerythrin n=1 Tax=Streptomyces tateyamensis TaxID=565073 RepID=A0A2V4NJ20_9ACTN|nr:hemerythrin domain-containing protein [Streptomyces tateyamensis]PYC70604.1 hemerythrin [Streptomyces tateyamensis]